MKVQNLLFLKMLVLLFSAILKKFGGLISNVMSPIESKNPHPLSPLGVKDFKLLTLQYSNQIFSEIFEHIFRKHGFTEANFVVKYRSR